MGSIMEILSEDRSNCNSIPQGAKLRWKIDPWGEQSPKREGTSSLSHYVEENLLPTWTPALDC